MKILSLIGIVAGIIIIGTTVAIIGNTQPRAEIRDDFGTFTQYSESGQSTASSSSGDFKTVGNETRDETPHAWYDDRKIADGTLMTQTLPTNAPNTATNTSYTHTPNNEADSETSLDVFVTNFWGERSNETTEVVTQDAEQSTLKNYGNTVGKSIQETVSTKLKSQNDTLIAFTKDTSKKESVLAIKNIYDSLSADIAAIKAPVGFVDAQKKLADGYAAIGTGLEHLANAREGTLYSAMIVYNEHVERFASAFVSYALLFGAHGVTFTQDEPGGIFTPPVSGM